MVKMHIKMHIKCALSDSYGEGSGWVRMTVKLRVTAMARVHVQKSENKGDRCGTEDTTSLTMSLHQSRLIFSSALKQVNVSALKQVLVSAIKQVISASKQVNDRDS
jgi:hypothetical protein